MEIKDLNALQLGACLQASFEKFWSQEAQHPVEISSTWCSDLGIALFYAKHDGDDKCIDETIDEGFESWKCDFDMSSQLIMACSYMASFCYGNDYYKSYYNTFSRAYHSLLLQIEHVYSDEEIALLADILD